MMRGNQLRQSTVTNWLSLAEEVGFEPTVPVTRYGGFQDRCLKPLDHSSFVRQKAEGRTQK
jgi:hypothetical protein